MLEINYTNTIDEIKRGFTRINNRYTIKRTIMFSVAYLIACILGIDMVIKNPSGIAGYILTAIGFAMLVSQWVKPYMVRNKLIKTLEGLNDENYTARFYDERIEIETEIIDNTPDTEIIAVTSNGIDSVTNPVVLEEVNNSDQIKPPVKSVIEIRQSELASEEDDVMFRLFVNRTYVYIFPKRCMNTEAIDKLRNYFNEKRI